MLWCTQAMCRHECGRPSSCPECSSSRVTVITCTQKHTKNMWLWPWPLTWPWNLKVSRDCRGPCSCKFHQAKCNGSWVIMLTLFWRCWKQYCMCGNKQKTNKTANKSTHKIHRESTNMALNPCTYLWLILTDFPNSSADSDSADKMIMWIGEEVLSARQKMLYAGLVNWTVG